MHYALINLKLCLDEIGGLQVNSPGDRIGMQKKAYLLQKAGGVNLGYRFEWYIRGPYSSGLTEDMSDLWLREKWVADDALKCELKDEVIEKISHIKPLLEMEPPKGLEGYEWLELLASVHALKHWVYIPDVCKDNEREFIETIKEQFPKFTYGQIHLAINTLKKWGLFPANVS